MAGPSLTFNLNDLDAWSRPGPCLAVVGWPIRHSLSPVMHNAALREMATQDKRFATWEYFRFEVEPEHLAAALPLFHARGFLGLNLTVPHKVLALDHIAKVDPAAQVAGAVNTLRATPAGWEGFNTDGLGLEAGLREDLGLSLAGQEILLLGAGGASRGAAVQCLRAGCRSLTLINRSLGNLEPLLRDLRPLSQGRPVRGLLTSSDADLPTECIVINATSAGMKPEDDLPFDLRRLRQPRAAYDMIYNPAETKWLAQARQLRIPAANGLSMLVHQGAAALALWTGRAVPAATMSAALQKARA